MARTGAFDDLDAAFNYHPSYSNMPSKASMVGVNDIRFRFHGTSGPCRRFPSSGKVCSGCRRTDECGCELPARTRDPAMWRMHYAITHGGDLPNVVPPEAEVWYFLRAHKPEELEEVTNRVRKVANGAAMMTENQNGRSIPFSLFSSR